MMALGRKGGSCDVEQMATNDRMAADRTGIGVPARVFMGGAGTDTCLPVRNHDQRHLDRVHHRLRRFDFAGAR